MGSGALITLIILIGLAVGMIAIYNRLVSLRLQGRNAFSQIEVQLKRRYDLIPSLVETAKGYMKHERDTLTAITEARDGAMQALGRLAVSHSAREASNLEQHESALTQSLERFRVTMEAYPELKANQSMEQFAEELSHTENKIARARQFYNDAVTEYNIYRSSMPQALLAPSFGHREDMPLLQFEDSARIAEAPKVSF